MWPCRWFLSFPPLLHITELDKTILNWLVDKNSISVVEVIGGEKVQKIRIVYSGGDRR